MHCTNCGANLTNTDKFCKACGYSVNGNYSNNNYNYNNNYNNNPQNGPKKEPLAVASLIIGIISLTFAIFFNFTILPLAFLGLILGIVNKATKGKKIAGIVLNIFAIVVVIVEILFIALFFNSNFFKSESFKEEMEKFYTEWKYRESENFIAGKYDCTGYDSYTDQYLISLYLYDNNTFLYGPYNRMEKNYAKGTYTYQPLTKKNDNGFKFFSVEMRGNKEDYIRDGEPSDQEFYSDFEIALIYKDSKKQGLLAFTTGYNNMYYCYEK